MFDMGFTELVLIGIVGLVIIGPERLPAVARTAGKYFGKLRRFMSNVKADVESELRADELRDILKTQSEELQSLKKVVDDVGKDVSSSVNELEESVADAPEGEIGQSWTEGLSAQSDDDASTSKAATPSVAKSPAKATKKKATKKKATKKKAAKPKARKVTSNE